LPDWPAVKIAGADSLTGTVTAGAVLPEIPTPTDVFAFPETPYGTTLVLATAR
jgi:hypothetical protein